MRKLYENEGMVDVSNATAESFKKVAEIQREVGGVIAAPDTQLAWQTFKSLGYTPWKRTLAELDEDTEIINDANSGNKVNYVVLVEEESLKESKRFKNLKTFEQFVSTDILEEGWKGKSALAGAALMGATALTPGIAKGAEREESGNIATSITAPEATLKGAGEDASIAYNQAMRDREQMQKNISQMKSAEKEWSKEQAMKRAKKIAIISSVTGLAVGGGAAVLNGIAANNPEGYVASKLWHEGDARLGKPVLRGKSEAAVGVGTAIVTAGFLYGTHWLVTSIENHQIKKIAKATGKSVDEVKAELYAKTPSGFEKGWDIVGNKFGSAAERTLADLKGKKASDFSYQELADMKANNPDLYRQLTQQ